jgi:heat shock protein HslJ
MTTRRLAALLGLLLLVAACAPGPGTGGQLEGTKWVLDSYDQDGTLTILPETLYADADFGSSRVSGFSGCNTYDALYRAGGRMLRVSQARSTLMACDEASMAFEARFLTLLQGSRFYTVRRDTLTVYEAQRPVLVFNAAPRNPLLGKWSVDSFGVPPSTAVAVLPDTVIDVVFGIGTVGGFAGCNSFSGTYGTNGSAVRVSRLATTRLACDEAVMEQETAFIAALEGAARIDSRGSTVILEDRDGFAQVFLTRPQVEPGPEASPTTAPTAEATATAAPTATATPEPTPTATPKPTPKPTAAPTATPEPTAPPTAAPTLPPLPSLPPSLPPTASCKLTPAGGPVVATIVYPGGWSTVTEPADLACRYFDPAPITVPDDVSTLSTAVQAAVDPAPYQDAVAAAIDPATWTVAAKSEFNVRGASVTCVGAIAAADTAGIPVGGARFACLAAVGTAGTVVLSTTGTPGDELFLTNAAVVSLMTVASTFIAPG